MRRKTFAELAEQVMPGYRAVQPHEPPGAATDPVSVDARTADPDTIRRFYADEAETATAAPAPEPEEAGGEASVEVGPVDFAASFAAASRGFDEEVVWADSADEPSIGIVPVEPATGAPGSSRPRAVVVTRTGEIVGFQG